MRSLGSRRAAKSAESMTVASEEEEEDKGGGLFNILDGGCSGLGSLGGFDQLLRRLVTEGSFPGCMMMVIWLPLLFGFELALLLLLLLFGVGRGLLISFISGEMTELVVMFRIRFWINQPQAIEMCPIFLLFLWVFKPLFWNVSGRPFLERKTTQCGALTCNDEWKEEKQFFFLTKKKKQPSTVNFCFVASTLNVGGSRKHHTHRK